MDLGFHPLAIAEDFLGGFLILPEAGLGYLLLDRFEFAAALGGVKENSESRWRGSSVLRILFLTPQSRSLLWDDCPLVVVGCSVLVVGCPYF
jgi:hypothetical protein